MIIPSARTLLRQQQHCYFTSARAAKSTAKTTTMALFSSVSTFLGSSSNGARLFSSSHRGPPPAAKRAGFSIPAQGFVFTALLLPVLGYTMYAGRYGPSEEDLERQVRERYSARIAENRDKNAAMADFFQHAIYNPDGKVDDSLKEVLYAGKGGKKRFYAVDDKWYGTSEGVQEKKRQEEERAKREEYKRRKKAGEIVEEPKDEKKSSKSKIKGSVARAEAPAAATTNGSGSIVLNAQSAATIGVVAIVAAGVGFLAGGGSRRA